MSPTSNSLLDGPIEVVHAGIDAVAEAPRAAGAPVTVVDFRPPAGGDPRRMALLGEVLAPPSSAAIDAANARALARLLASRPHLVGIGTARDVVPGMDEDLFLHAGPPVTWERMCGPMRGAVLGGLLYEGRAKDAAEAERLAASGAVRFDPCHHHDAVGPMAGLVTPSMPVFVIEDRGGERAGARTFCTLNEGLGKVLRYGAFSEEVVARLVFMRDELAPVLAEALALRGPIDLKHLLAQALQMGDEGHNRNRAGTSLLFRELAPAVVRATADRERAARVLDFVNGNDHFFLNLTMPTGKCMLKAAEGEALSSLVSVMARNGTDFGIQLASMPGRWFTGPALPVRGLYFPGFTEADANPDIGDSAITETAGFGGFAMAAAPAIVQFVGGSAEDALAATRAMRRITLGPNPGFAIPALGFSGTPTGIDLRLVEERNLLPQINTGIAHREPGVGQVGAGLVTPPWEAFHAALEAFAEHVRASRA
ncbi:MAG: YlbE family protein [Thermoanaerobaculia bacterium]